MRIHAAHLGAVQLVPPRAGVSIDTAKQACAIAHGIWDPTANACSLEMGSNIPTWCNYVPFSTSLFDECALPDASAIAAEGNYTAYMTGQLPTAAFTNAAGGPTGQTGSGLDVERGMVQQNQDSGQQLFAQMNDCAYQAAQNHSVLSQILGPDLVCSLTDPFNSTSLIPGWLLYVGLGIAGLVVFSLVAGRR